MRSPVFKPSNCASPVKVPVAGFAREISTLGAINFYKALDRVTAATEWRGRHVISFMVIAFYARSRLGEHYLQSGLAVLPRIVPQIVAARFS
jgi:hypothetical protein